MLYCIVNWKQFFFGENYWENEKSFCPFSFHPENAKCGRDDGKIAEGVSGSFRLFLFFLFIITLTLYVFVLVCVFVCMLFNIPQHTHTPLTNVTPLFCYMFFFSRCIESTYFFDACEFVVFGRASCTILGAIVQYITIYYLLSWLITMNCTPNKMLSHSSIELRAASSTFSVFFSANERSLFTLSIMCFDHTQYSLLYSCAFFSTVS